MDSVEVTQSAEVRAESETGRRRPCLCEAYARVTESAALAAARWLGSGDEASAVSVRPWATRRASAHTRRPSSAADTTTGPTAPVPNTRVRP